MIWGPGSLSTRKLTRRALHRLVSRQAEALTRVRQYLVSARSKGSTHVPIDHVIDLLDPEGCWQTEGPQLQTAVLPPPDPRADPITGCLPVTADGGPAPHDG